MWHVTHLLQHTNAVQLHHIVFDVLPVTEGVAKVYLLIDVHGLFDGI